MTFDFVLNVLWLLLGLLAFVTTLRISRRRKGSVQRRHVWQSCAAVAVAVATLFPIVSATDDLLRIQTAQRQHDARESSDRRPAQKPVSDSLIRLYESMDMPLMAVASQLFLTLLFVSFLNVLLQNGVDRSNPSASGRSPPALFCS